MAIVNYVMAMAEYFLKVMINCLGSKGGMLPQVVWGVVIKEKKIILQSPLGRNREFGKFYKSRGLKKKRGL